MAAAEFNVNLLKTNLYDNTFTISSCINIGGILIGFGDFVLNFNHIMQEHQSVSYPIILIFLTEVSTFQLIFVKYRMWLNFLPLSMILQNWIFVVMIAHDFLWATPEAFVTTDIRSSVPSSFKLVLEDFGRCWWFMAKAEIVILIF